MGCVLRVFDSVFFLHQVSEAECEGALEEHGGTCVACV